MKKILLSILLLVVSLGSVVNAKTTTTYINLEDLTYSTTQKDAKNIKEYSSYDDFLKDYQSNSLPNIYITNFLFDGVSMVKTPDLDDFIENNSNDTEIDVLKIKVINVNAVGSYELTGEIKGAMLAVNTNDLKGEINFILNGVTLDTDSKKAPAIYVYNKDKTYTECKVTISTVSGTKNYLEGGKLKKVSLISTEDYETYSKYYSGDSLSNYQKYSSYYGIYTKDEIENILFATVQADQEDLSDGDPYYFYKASGAVSSDIDIYFEGEGFLQVTSKNKEGIESKGNLSFTGGTGDYVIYAEDDCLNTTTVSSMGQEIHNDIIIDVSSLLASVSEDADEGDAIDSNGTLTINGGSIYAFANPNSGDAGLDSQKGTYINGGTIIATGNMADAISSESKQNYFFANVNHVDKDTLIAIKDQDDKIITAFKTNRKIQNLFYSSPSLKAKSYKLYTGGTIDGEEKNGLYTKINSYSGGEELSYRNIGSMSQSSTSTNSFVILLIWMGEILLLVVSSVFYFIRKKRSVNAS